MPPCGSPLNSTTKSVPLPVSELNASSVTIREDRGAIPAMRSNTSCGMTTRSSAAFALSGSVGIRSTSRPLPSRTRPSGSIVPPGGRPPPNEMTLHRKLTMLAITAALHVLLYRTRFGLGLRAIVENSVAASLSGIDVQSTMLKAFALASAIGGVAGFLVLSANQQVTAMLGMWATLKGLIAMMIGGLGSIPGAIVGGLVLGIIEVHSQTLFGPQVRDLAAYGVLFVLLVLWPGGIFGTAANNESVGHRGGDRWTTT